MGPRRLRRTLLVATPAATDHPVRGPSAGRSAAELTTLRGSKSLEHKQTFAFNIRTKKKDAALADAVLEGGLRRRWLPGS